MKLNYRLKMPPAQKLVVCSILLLGSLYVPHIPQLENTNNEMPGLMCS